MPVTCLLLRSNLLSAMKYLLILVCAISNTLPCLAQFNLPQQSQIDSIFSDWNLPNSPGGSVGIIKDGAFLMTKGYGYANLDYNLPNASNSVFRIASTSKQFTAACVLLLEQEGKLSLTDKLSKFFPEFPSYANEITVQHLLNHTSGVRDYLTLAQLAGLESEDYYTDETVEKWLTHQEELNFSPGEEFLYSNSGYWLLGQIVAKASDTTMAAYAHKKLFAPLKMSETHFHDNHNRIVKNRATGYRPHSDYGFSINTTTLDMVGDGGIFTTVEDLKKWDDAYYNSTVLNREFWNKMTKVGQLNNGKKLNYASGLGVDEYHGLKVIQHGGAFVGYRAEMIRFPEQHFSVIVLANRADAQPTRLAFEVADIFLKDQFIETAPSHPKNNQKKKVKPIRLSTKKLQSFEGIYWSNNSQISRSLEIRNDTLNYVRSNGRATKMIPIGKNVFKWDNPNYTITVEVNTNTNPKTFTLNFPDEDPILYTEYTPVKKLSPQDLSTLSGTYHSKELNVEYCIMAKENDLVLYIEGKEIGKLKPIKKNLFMYESFLTFVYNDDRSQFELSMGRVKHLKFRKK